MNVLCYALPCFLGNGETFKYCINHLNILLNCSETTDFNPIIIKEKSISMDSIESYKDTIPKVDSIDFSLNNISNLRNIIVNKDIDIYHCFHNGFSLSKALKTQCISTIYTTLPLINTECLETSYSDLYLSRIVNSIHCSHKIIVPYDFMRNDLCNFFSINEDNIFVIPPQISFDLIGKSKPLSKAYVRSKFNILNNYYLYIGEINPRNTLIDTIKLFKYYTSIHDSNLVLSLTFLPKNKNLYFELISFIDRIGLSSKVTFINKLFNDDLVNLINGSICFLNLNPFSELNITSLYALFLNTNILTYQTRSNLEFLENFPIYISNYTDGFNINFCEKSPMDINELYYIIQKFNFNTIFESLYGVYDLIIKERG